jgi:hypothetical protein
MSKLADAIRKTVRQEAAPMGFQYTAARQKNATMLIIATVRQITGAAASKLTAAGADSILLAADATAGLDLAAAAKAAGAASLGVWLRKADGGSAPAAREAGVDHIVFSDDSAPAQMLLDEKLGFVLSLAEGLDDTTLRAIETLPLDAVLVSYWDGELTVRRALELRRLAGLSRKPLMLSVSPAISGAELEALRDCGVAAVIIDGEKTGADDLRKLRETITALPPRRKRRDERGEAVSLPAPAASAAHEHDEEDDD